MSRAGQMRHRLMIKRDVAATTDFDSRGQHTAKVATIGSRRGSIQHLSGRELSFARQIVDDATHKIVIRYFDGLKTSDWLEDDLTGRTYTIDTIGDPRQMKRRQEIICKERST